MSALFAFLLSNPTIIAVFGGVVMAIAAFMKGRVSGAKKEQAKQLEERQKARTVADEVDNDIGAMPADAARKELSRWDL